ncbi:MAG: hypothetical protein H6581_16415 [Bacteroidia bacterium]|nr:hypothetical protein [Bacteroidia bacterium]
MSNTGRTIISALNQGDYHVVSQYPNLGEQDIKIINHYAHELFETAVTSRNLPLLQAILEIPRIQVNKKEYQVLLESVKAGLVEFVQELGRVNGVDPNVRNTAGDTALILAQKGSWGEDKALLLTGWICALGDVIVNARGEERKTALHHALQNGWYKVAMRLMENGANPKIPDENDETSLNLALSASNLPGDLFSMMLGYDGPEPDELEGIDPPKEAAATPDPAQHQGPKAKDTPFPHVPPPLQATPLPPEAFQKKTPGVDVTNPLGSPQDPSIDQDGPDVVTPIGNPNNAHHSTRPVTPTPALQDDDPRIRTVTTSMSPSMPQTRAGFDPPDVPAPDPEKPRVQPQRRTNETLEEVLEMKEGQSLADVLTRDHLMSSPADGGPIRLHRRALLAQLVKVDEILKKQDGGLSEADARQKDPVTEDTLWHAAARHDQFLTVLRYLVAKGFWPQVNDFTARNYEGLTVIDILDQRGRLHEVLHAPEWGQHPASLAHIIANIPRQKRGAFAALIARTNLILRG